ncbi:hypothetical protein RGQ21_02190 [Kitasatospora aureofaciens]|nr:hypothetical protein RGQ21_02190 [Kitasatospora aureofaciens]
MEAELGKGPAARGWEDQCWTLSRVKTVIGRRFSLTYTIQGVRKLLVRNAGPARSRPDAPSSGTTRRWPAGSRRCGLARKTCGGEWSLARLRGRSRILHDAAAWQDLVTARPDPGGAGPRPIPQTHLQSQR